MRKLDPLRQAELQEYFSNALCLVTNAATPAGHFTGHQCGRYRRSRTVAVHCVTRSESVCLRHEQRSRDVRLISVMTRPHDNIPEYNRQQ